MAITFVNKSAFASGTGALSVGAVANVVADDLILLFVESANQAITTPTGFTQVTSSPVSTGTAAAAGGVRLTVFYRWATGADTTTSVADSGDHTTAIKLAYRGVSLLNPFDATPTTAIKTPASTSSSFPGITTVTPNTCIIHASALDLDSASTATTGTPTNANLTGLVERHDQTVTAGAGGGLVIIEGFDAVAGATGNTTATVTSTIQVYLTMALREAPRELILTAEEGVFTVAGIANNFSLVKRLTAETGSVTLTGNNAIVGRLFTLTAQAASFSAQTNEATITSARRLLADSRSYTVATPDAGLRAQRFLRADAQTYALTANDAGVLAFRRLRADVVAYTATFNNARVAKNYPFAAEAASFSVAFIDAGLNFDLNEYPPEPEVNGAELLWYEILGEPIPSLTLAADLGQYDVAGIDAKVLRGYKLTAETRSYAVSGVNNAFRRTYSLKADIRTYSVTGIDNVLKTARRLQADVRSYLVTRNDGRLLFSRNLKADIRTYAVTAREANFRFQRFLRAALGTYAATFNDAGIKKGFRLGADLGRFDTNAYYNPGYIDPEYFSASAKLLRGYHLRSDVRTYQVTSYPTIFTKTKLFVAESGAFVLSGQDARLLTARKLPVSAGAYQVDMGGEIVFRWQHILRPLVQTYDAAAVPALLYKNYYIQAVQSEYSLDGFDSRPYVSSLPSAEGYVIRPMEIRSAVRGEEQRTAVRPADPNSVMRPEEDRMAEHM